MPVSLSPPLTAEHADLALRFHELMLPHLDAAYNLARYLLRDPVAAETSRRTHSCERSAPLRAIEGVIRRPGS